MIEARFKRNPEKLEKLRQIVIDNKGTIDQQNRQVIERRWNDFYEIYRGLDAKGSYRGRANLDWAMGFVSIEIILPRLYRSLFPSGKWFGVDGVEAGDRKQASIIEAYMRKIYESPIQVRQKMISYLRYLCIYGTLVCKTPFRYETKKIPRKRRRSTESGSEIITTSEEAVIWDNIDLQLVDLFDFYVADDTIPSLEEQPFVIHHTIESIGHLKRKEYDDEESPEGVYENLDAIKFKKKDGSNLHMPLMNPSLNSRLQSLGMSSRYFKSDGPPVHLDEYQGLVDIGDGDELMVITVANGNTIIQAETLNTPDQEKTYIKTPYIDMPNEFWGMSALERVQSTIYELNDRVSQTMDATSLVINPIWLNSDADIPEGQLSLFPGRVVKTTTEKGLTALRPDTSILTPAYTAIQAIVSMIQDTTGATRFLGGSAQVPELQRTATGILSIVKEANARLDLIIQGIESSFIKPFLRKSYKYSQFYATKKQVVRIVGKHAIEYAEYDPENILIDVDFRPLGVQSLGSEEIVTQQAINFLNILIKLPPELLQGYDIGYLIQKISQNMLGMEDADELDRTNRRQQEDQEKAIAENQQMFSGVAAVAQPNENHRLHMEIHMGALQDQRFQQLPNPQVTQQLIEEHIREHQFYMQLQSMQLLNQAQQGAPRGSQSGIPTQEQPQPTAQEDIINQLSQPSQEGTL